MALGAAVLVAVVTGWGITAFTGDTSAPSRGAPAPPPAKPSGAGAQRRPPPACPDEAIRVRAEVAQPEYRVGERVDLRFTVTNVGDRACRRDTGAAVRETIVSTVEGKRVWSSDDCHIRTTNEKPLLAPGQTVRNGITWLGRTSAPECPIDRSRASAGEYRVVAKLGSLASEPVSFRLTPADEEPEASRTRDSRAPSP